MPGLAEVIVLAVVVVLLAVLTTIAWRLTRWFFRTRRILGFIASVDELVASTEAVLGPIAERVDGVRRVTLAGEEIMADLERGQAAAGALAAEARTIRAPAGSEGIVRTIADELERAVRALETVEHGCELLAAGGRGREYDPEAQTSVKRGYLNLLHSRESIAEQKAAAHALPVTVPRLFPRRAAE